MKHTTQRLLIHSGVFLLLSFGVAHSALATVAPQYPNPLDPDGNGVNGGPLTGPSTIPEFLALVLQGLSLLLIPLVVLFIIYAGYLFVTAQGEEGKIQKAKTALWYTIIGAAVILGAQIMADILSDTLTDLNTP